MRTSRYGLAESIQRYMTLSVTIWFSALLLRSFGFPFTGILYIIGCLMVSGSVLRILIIWWLHHRSKPFPFTVLLTGILFGLLLPKVGRSYTGEIAACMALLLAIIGFGIDVVYERRMTGIAWKLPLLLVSALTAFLPSRSFHHLFRASTFESYVVDHFEEGSEQAWELVTSGYVPDSLEARRLKAVSRKADEARQIPQAMQSINQSLELDPFDAEAYLLRGKIRLLRTELDQESAQDARKDFSLAIRQDPTLAEAYLLRAQAGSYLKWDEKVCPDIIKIRTLDTALYRYARRLFDHCDPDSTGHLASE